MKARLLLGFALILIFSSCREQNMVTLSGDIQNHGQAKLQLSNFFGTSAWRSEIDVNNGIFEVNLPIEKPVIQSVSYGMSSKTLFLEPGQTLNISFDAENVDGSIRFGGTLAPENSIIDSLSRSINIDYSYIYTQPLELAAAYLDSTSDAANRHLEELLKDVQSSPEFDDYARAFIDYQAAGLKIIIGERQDEQPEGYYGFLDQLKIESESWIDIPEYRMFLYQLVEMNVNKRMKALEATHQESADAHLTERLNVIEEFENEEVRAYALFNAMHTYLLENGVDEFEKHYEPFRERNSDPYYDEQMRLAYEEKQKLAPGQPAPQFTLADVDGSQVSLSDFRGQYVFLDFWATLCPRSARELPYYLDLHSTYENENIAFVSISNDPDSKKWSDYVKEKKDVGVSLIAQNGWDSDVLRDYQVFGLPTFVLIDTDGNIIDPVAAKPSTQEIRESLDQLLMN
jgi:peroxiredoxin